VWSGRRGASQHARVPRADFPEWLTDRRLLRFIAAAAELVRADMDRIEPRCRICRDPGVRRLVDDRLDWHGVPIFLARGKTHRVTYADIFGDVAALNESRDPRAPITYSSLWVHAKRHHDLSARVAACRRIRMYTDFRNALANNGCSTPNEFLQDSSHEVRRT